MANEDRWAAQHARYCWPVLPESHLKRGGSEQMQGQIALLRYERDSDWAQSAAEESD
jgi:hypothetical protein